MKSKKSAALSGTVKEKIYQIKKPVISKFSDIDLSATYSYASYLLWEFEERVELIKGKVFQMSA